MKRGLSASLEDYLEAIYDLHSERREPVRVNEIASRLAVKMPSVSAALKSLQERELVHHEPYGDVELTEKGLSIGRHMRQRHTTLVAFLHDILGVEGEQAEREACELEHSLSAETLDRLAELTDYLEKHPTGGDGWRGGARQQRRGQGPGAGRARRGVKCVDPVLSPAQMREGVPLNLFCPGFRGQVRKVRGMGPLRKRLMEMGITPGSELQILRVAPLGDPIEINVRGYNLSLRKSEAAHIHVVPEDDQKAEG